MIRHALHAGPWLLIGVAAAVTTLLLLVLKADPYQLWPLQGIAVGFVAAACAWVFDEPAAHIVDTLPRSLLWRTIARGLIVVAVSGWWLLSVAFVGTAALLGHADDVARQGLVAILGVTAMVTWLRSRHVATPANRVSAVVVALVVFVALVRPLQGRLPLFPYTAAGQWTASAWWWGTIALAATLTLVLAVTGPSSGPHSRHPQGAGIRRTPR